jgi:hypothetical protein
MLRSEEIIWAAMERNPRIIERFWSYVQRDVTGDGCWDWVGQVRPDGSPTFVVGYRSVAPSRVAWYAATGEPICFGRLARSCGNHMCVRPNHLQWSLSEGAEQRMIARTDGYVGLSGSPVEHARPRRNRRHSVRRIAVMLALVAVGACDSRGGPDIAGIGVPAPVNTQLAISPSSMRVTVGQSVQLATNVPMARQGDVQWESLRPDIASVDPNGLVLAVSSGFATIVAHLSFDISAVGTATIEVAPSGLP